MKDFRYSVFSAYYSQQWFENCLANYRRQSTVGTWRPPYCPISRTALKASVAVEAEKRANANDLTTLYPNGYCIAIEACLKPSALDEVTSGKFRSYSLVELPQKKLCHAHKFCFSRCHLPCISCGTTTVSLTLCNSPLTRIRRSRPGSL